MLTQKAADGTGATGMEAMMAAGEMQDYNNNGIEQQPDELGEALGNEFEGIGQGVGDDGDFKESPSPDVFENYDLQMNREIENEPEIKVENDDDNQMYSQQDNQNESSFNLNFQSNSDSRKQSHPTDEGSFNMGGFGNAVVEDKDAIIQYEPVDVNVQIEDDEKSNDDNVLGVKQLEVEETVKAEIQVEESLAQQTVEMSETKELSDQGQDP